MERDPKISKLFREGGVVLAPEDFTSRVMGLIGEKQEKRAYKPLIGIGGRIFILLLIITIVLISIIYAEPGSRFIPARGANSMLNWKLPGFHPDLQFFSEINFSSVFAAALVAVFILVLLDAGIRKRKLI